MREWHFIIGNTSCAYKPKSNFMFAESLIIMCLVEPIASVKLKQLSWRHADYFMVPGIPPWYFSGTNFLSHRRVCPLQSVHRDYYHNV